MNTAIILMVLTFTVCPLQALKCYHCTRDDKGCAPPFSPSSAFEFECPSIGFSGCGTFITTIAGRQYYDRSCAPNSLTLDLSTVESIHGTKCTTALCNTDAQQQICATGTRAAVNHFAFLTLLSTLIATRMWWLDVCIWFSKYLPITYKNYWITSKWQC